MNKWRVVTPAGKVIHCENEHECFKYILKAQPQSVFWAVSYAGWKIVNSGTVQKY